MPGYPLRALAAAAALLVAMACSQNRGQSQGSAADFRRAMSGTDWELVELEGQSDPPPTGVGGRRPTLRFEPDSARVAGFAGCNRFSGSYTVDGSSFRFGPLAMTRMACAEGMDVEQRLVRVLERVDRYVTADDSIDFYGGASAIARFARVAR